MFSGRENLLAGKFPRNIGCVHAVYSIFKNFLYHFRSLRVRRQTAILTLAITIRTNLALVFTPLEFQIFGRFGLYRHITAVILTD